ncbi:hypothetical protein [Lentzea californiensis]|uniref:hypothetical protein n=1 Tax=Lentzea californiensis TaxID=438851 RepID=UPI0021640B63|nr:hypothetical protein [Lentzea californiensis]MCR3746653.1 hypothetical protein [Lentzea californiensis]
MNAPTYAPDGITSDAVTRLLSKLSKEIASPHAPTSALLDGSAVERRNARMLARAAAGVVPKYGVTLAQAEQEATAPVRKALVATVPAPVYGKRKSNGRRAARNAIRAQVVGRVARTEAA